MSDSSPAFLDPNTSLQNKTWTQNQSPPSAPSLWLPLPNTNNHFPPFLFSPLCETPRCLWLGCFNYQRTTSATASGRGAEEKGSVGPPRWERGDEARTPCHITRRRRPINSHNGHISAARFVSLTYILPLCICSLEACFTKGSRWGQVVLIWKMSPYFVVRLAAWCTRGCA